MLIVITCACLGLQNSICYTIMLLWGKMKSQGVATLKSRLNLKNYAPFHINLMCSVLVGIKTSLFKILHFTQFMGTWAQNWRQGIVMKTTFKTPGLRAGLGSFVNINSFV